MSEYSVQGPEFYPDDDDQTWMSDCRSAAKQESDDSWKETMSVLRESGYTR